MEEKPKSEPIDIPRKEIKDFNYPNPPPWKPLGLFSEYEIRLKRKPCYQKSEDIYEDDLWFRQ